MNPRADQRSVAAKYSRDHPGMVVTISFSQFQSKLIDVRGYLGVRDRYTFGSVRYPGIEQAQTQIEYIPMDLVQIGKSRLWQVSEISDGLQEGKRFLLLGDYGAGKSMTLRELYYILKKRYQRATTSKFPVYLNLRDHHGQQDPAEALERHARTVGFQHPSHLVRAWRAGYAILLLDGFDEIGGVPWVGPWERLQDTRYNAMQLVRKYLSETPIETGVAMAGRAYYFDGERERSRALGITGNFTELSLNDFTEEQIALYIQQNGFDGKVPPWVPARPLLLGTLLARGLIGAVSATDLSNSSTVMEPAAGWNILLDQIAQREARIEAGIDHETLRRIYERLATKARSTPNGLGPLTMEQITRAFQEICEYPPDEQANLLLLRLPGLGIDQEAESTRKFIDEDLVDVCRAGDPVEFSRDPFRFDVSIFEGATHTMGSLGVRVAANRLDQAGFPRGQMHMVLQRASDQLKSGCLIGDLGSHCYGQRVGRRHLRVCYRS